MFVSYEGSATSGTRDRSPSSAAPTRSSDAVGGAGGAPRRVWRRQADDEVPTGEAFARAETRGTSTSETDGLAVTPSEIPGYPGGLLVVHDTANEGFTGNFKLVAWQDVAAAL